MGNFCCPNTTNKIAERETEPVAEKSGHGSPELGLVVDGVREVRPQMKRLEIAARKPIRLHRTGPPPTHSRRAAAAATATEDDGVKRHSITCTAGTGGGPGSPEAVPTATAGTCPPGQVRRRGGASSARTRTGAGAGAEATTTTATTRGATLAAALTTAASARTSRRGFPRWLPAFVRFRRDSSTRAGSDDRDSYHMRLSSHGSLTSSSGATSLKLDVRVVDDPDELATRESVYDEVVKIPVRRKFVTKVV